jgi:hypothetical protein
MYEFSSLPEAEVDAVARELLLSTYDERMDEYASVGDDWLKEVLVRYGAHVAAAMSECERSFELAMAAQVNMVALHTAMMERAPEFFRR